jgi:archaeosine-15-forming tRNA-guanine transglycosylase
MNLEDMKVAQNMRRYGGNFIISLAMAALAADSINLAKIKQTWAEEWEEYKYKGRNICEEEEE